MTELHESRWANDKFAQKYRENADIFILERRRLLEILKSFYKHFIGSEPNINILDLGCGDGIAAHELLKVNHSISATLVDGSGDMLSKAQERLKEFEKVHFIKGSFQEIINDGISLQGFDLVISSLAIHHLPIEDKTALFRKVYSGLNAGGCFLVIDVLLTPTESLEQWYLRLWKEWIEERKFALGLKDGCYDDFVQGYKNNPDNHPDTIDSQLSSLKFAGFKDVDCFYKYGIFTVFGGRK